MKAEDAVDEIHTNKKNPVAMRSGQPHAFLYVILVCYTFLFYLITIFQMNLIIAVLHLPHLIFHPKNMEEKISKNKKMAWCVHGRYLFLLPLNNRLFFVLVNHFLYPFCFSPSIIINTLATYTLEARGVFSVFIILLQNPSPGSRSWNVTIFLRTKTIKEESPHGNQLESYRNDSWSMRLSREKPWARLRF